MLRTAQEWARSSWKRALEEVRAAIGGLEAGESFNIIAFYGRFKRFQKQLVPANPDEIRGANRFLDGVKLDNGINLERALNIALSTKGVNVVVVITDSEPTFGERDFDKLARLIKKRNTARAQIHTIALAGKNADGTTENFEAARLLRNIAAQNGGNFKQITLGQSGSPAPN